MAKKKDEVSGTFKARQEALPKSDDEKDSEDDGSLEDDKYLIEYIKNCKKEGEQASKDIREVQRELWLLFQNKEDWSKKKKWQSKIFIPKIFMAVIRAAALVKRAILQTSKLFSMKIKDEDISPLRAEIKQMKKKLAKEAKNTPEGAQATQERTQGRKALEGILEASEERLESKEEQRDEDDRRFKGELKKSNFSKAYGEMITSAILLGMGDLKTLWDDRKKKLTYENIDILNLYISPDYMPSEDEDPEYLIEYKEMSLAKLRKMAEAVNKAAGDDIFDMDEIEKIKAGHIKTEAAEKERQRRGLSQFGRRSKKVGILEFFGNVESKDGKTEKENQLMVLVNEKHLIRNQPNPMPNGNSPHNLTVPMVYPHRGIAGVSLVSSAVRLQYTENNVLNMVIDNLNFIVNQVRTYDPNLLKKPQDAFSVYPGKMIPVNSGPGKAIDVVETKPLGQDVWKALEVINTETQEAHAITEFITGMTGKRQKTLGEVEIKTAESHGLFDVIARELENNSVRPVLSDSWDLLVAFSKGFKGSYEFNVGGLSLLLLQKDQVDKLMQALAIALKAQPILGPVTDIDNLWQQILSLWNVTDVFKEREEEPEVGVLQPGMPQSGAPQSGQPQLQPGQPQGPAPEQVEMQAAQDARQFVAQMPPEEIMRA